MPSKRCSKPDRNRGIKTDGPIPALRCTSRHRRIVCLWICLFLFWAAEIRANAGSGLPGSILASQNLMQSQKSPEEVEYQVKAAFIYNFMKFTDWPKERMESSEAADQEQPSATPKPPMVIGIVGNSPFGRAFDALMDKKIKDRGLKIVEIPGMGDYVRKLPDRSQAAQQYFQDHRATLLACHVLFFCNSEKNFLTEHLREARETSALTVGDMERFVEQKGIICFVKEDNKIRFEIHLTQAEKQHLKISSQLLKLARRVIQEKEPNEK